MPDASLYLSKYGNYYTPVLDMKGKGRSCSGRSARSKSKAETFRSTPWYSTQEFDFVGRGLSVATQLFSTNSFSQDDGQSQDALRLLHHALQRVSVWQQRWDRIPHSIEISASLAQVLLLDFKQQQQPQDSWDASRQDATPILNSLIPSPRFHFCMVLRSAYATSIVRAVNGIADSTQRNRSLACYYPSSPTHSRTSHSLSIANLCSMLGLPSWIVHVRHDSTHKELPSLMVLRLAAQHLLIFMIEEYFTQPQRQFLLVQQKAMSLLESYENLCSKQDATPTQPGDDEEPQAEVVVLGKSMATNGESQNNLLIVQKEKLVVQEMTIQMEENNCNKISSAEYEASCNERGQESILPSGTMVNMKPTNQEKKRKKRLEKQMRAEVIQEKIRLYGFFGVLVESRPNPPLKKHKISSSTHSNISPTNDKKDTGASTKEPKRTIQRTNQRSLVACAKNFVSDTPMDVGFDQALSYLIWGREKNSLNGSNESSPCGVLFSKRSELHNFASSDCDKKKDDHDARNSLFEIGKNKYTILLRAIIGHWHGFFHSFLVHLIESFICIQDETRISTNPFLGLSLDQQASTTTQPSKKWIIEGTIFSWVKYILSREFLSAFDTSISVFKRVNLNKKDMSQWSKEERSFMESPAPYTSLRPFNLPLNSLYRRCQVGNEMSEIGGKIICVFRDILEKSNVKSNNCHNKKQSDVTGEDTHRKSNITSGMDESGVCAAISREINSTNDVERDTSSFQSTDEDEKITNIDRVPWTFCETWEACSIGTLPGYVS